MVWSILKGLISVADVVIVAYGIYRLILALKNTRAMQVVKGVLLLFFCYLLSGWLHLDAVNWILGKKLERDSDWNRHYFPAGIAQSFGTSGARPSIWIWSRRW